MEDSEPQPLTDIVQFAEWYREFVEAERERFSASLGIPQRIIEEAVESSYSNYRGQ
jgi:hypothetical protein